jgi:hypothetical protein
VVGRLAAQESKLIAGHSMARLGGLLQGEIVVGEYRLDILKQLVDLS